jgi:hypothetical protein
MPVYQVRYLDGPCVAKTPPPVSLQAPPPRLSCGGRDYKLSFNTPAPRGAKYDFVVSYAVPGGDYDHTPDKIAGQRDVFRAWAQIHRALNHTVPYKVNRIRRAGRRIRRAVR